MLHKSLFLIALLMSYPQTEVRSKDPEFGLQLPAGYHSLDPTPPGVTYSWRRTIGEQGIAVTLQVLPGTIGLDSTDVEKMKASFAKKFPQEQSFNVRKEKWREFEILVLETEVGEGHGFMLSSQIPLAPKALQFRVVGPIAMKEE